MKYPPKKQTKRSNKRVTQRQNIKQQIKKNTDQCLDLDDKKSKKSQLYSKEKQDIKQYLSNLELEGLLNYVDKLNKQDIFSIALTFNQISLRIQQQPQILHTIKPSNNFLDNLILMPKILNTKWIQFSKNNSQQRDLYLRNFLMLILYILNCVNNILNQQLKQKLLSKKNFVKNILTLDICTSDQDCCSSYIIVMKLIYDYQLSLVQKKQLAASIIRNFKYFSQRFITGLLGLLGLLICLRKQEKNIFNWRIIKKYNFIQNLQIIFQSNKNFIISLWALVLLVDFIEKFKSTIKILNLSNTFKFFQITGNFKQFIVYDHNFRENYISYLVNCCPLICTKEMGKLCEHFIQHLKQIANNEQKFNQVECGVWFQFLLDAIKVTITNGNESQNIEILVHSGLLESLIKLIQFQSIDQGQEDRIFFILHICLPYLQVHFPHYYNCNISLIFDALRYDARYQDDQNWIRHRFQMQMYRTFHALSYDKLLLK